MEKPYEEALYLNSPEPEENITVMSLYEVAGNGQSVVASSSKLPIFEVQINGENIA